MTERFDAVVVGAGPAGALVARELARRGCRVLLVDRERFPRWTVCGACLGAPGVAVLRAVGLEGLLEDSGARPLQRLRIVGWGRAVDLPVEGGVVVSRRTLDAALLAEAGAAGAVVRTGCTAALDGETPEVRRVRLREAGSTEVVEALCVIDASGLGGLRGDQPGRERHEVVRENSRIGVGACFPPGSCPPIEAEPETVSMAVGSGGYVGRVVHEDGSVGVAAALAPGEVRRFEGPAGAVTALLESVGASLPTGAATDGWKGTPPLTRTRRRRAERRLFAIGDAAGYVEPFTGEGMSWALMGAYALVPLAEEAIRAWHDTAVERWESRYRLHVARRQRLSGAVAWLSRNPFLARGALGVLGARPGLARPFLRQAARPPLGESGS
ncbi:MAG: FAD-dependent monooxygenase [Gemmatimonadetes bacterium]|nr:FAD-dependent monooxygenase [Gemmatimonadota bacterium]